MKKGLPAKNWYILNEVRLLEMLDCQSTSGVKFDTTGDIKSDTTGDVKSERTFNKNTKSKNTSKNTDIYISVVDHLNEKAGTSYRPSSKATQGHINARLAEGFTVEDFFCVIDKKCAEWKGDEKMEKYLRPETLFGSKFENYLNAPVSQRKTQGNSIQIINGKEYEYRNGKYYIPNGSGIPVDPFAKDELEGIF